MSLVNVETGELVEPMSLDAARRLTERIRIAAANYTDAKAKVLQLVDEAKVGGAWRVLGYKSWTAYLSDTLSDEPLRLAREDRRELVTKLADEGMSTRAIAPIVGAHHTTVAADLSTVGNPTVGAAPVVRITEGLDGRERTTVTSGQMQKPARSVVAPPPADDVRRTADAETFNALMAFVRRAVTPERTAALKPRAREALIRTFQTAIEVLDQKEQS